MMRIGKTRLTAALGTLVLAAALIAAILISGAEREYPLPAHIELPPQEAAAPPAEVSVTTGPWNDLYPVWSPDGRRIAFVSDRFGSWTVWIVNSDGGGLKQISRNGSISRYPSWSPDGRKVAYWSFSGSRVDIFVRDLDSMVETAVTADEALEYPDPPRWSPDGGRLLFSKWSEGWHIWLSDISTFQTGQLTYGNGDDVSPSWSVDGRKVVYVSNRTGSSELWMIDLESGEDKMLTSGEGQKIMPVVSPDGRRIAYLSDKVPERVGGLPWHYPRESIGWNVWVISIDGGNETFQYTFVASEYRGVVPDLPVEDRPGNLDLSVYPQWSPDSKKICYVTRSSTFGGGIFVWDMVGNIYRLADSTQDETTPSWSPDGKSIIFASNRSGSYDIWITSGELKAPSVAGGY